MIPSLQELAEQFVRMLAAESVPGSTGYQPVPSGDSPDGMARSDRSPKDARLSGGTSSIPVGESPTGAGGSPDPPTHRTSPEPIGPVQLVDYAAKGVHLDVTIAAKQAVPVAQLLDQHGFSLDTITGVDWIAQEQMEVVYDYFHPQTNLRVAVRCRIPRSAAEVPSIQEVFPGANWHERETHEFLGIRFLGHPNLTPLLLPEDATYHPLRKDFVA